MFWWVWLDLNQRCFLEEVTGLQSAAFTTRRTHPQTGARGETRTR